MAHHGALRAPESAQKDDTSWTTRNLSVCCPREAQMDQGVDKLLSKVAPDRRKPGVNPLDTGKFVAEAGSRPEAFRAPYRGSVGVPAAIARAIHEVWLIGLVNDPGYSTTIWPSPEGRPSRPRSSRAATRQRKAPAQATGSSRVAGPRRAARARCRLPPGAARPSRWSRGGTSAGPPASDRYEQGVAPRDEAGGRRRQVEGPLRRLARAHQGALRL